MINGMDTKLFTVLIIYKFPLFKNNSVIIIKPTILTKSFYNQNSFYCESKLKKKKGGEMKYCKYISY